MESKQAGYLKFMILSVLGVLAVTATLNYAGMNTEAQKKETKAAIFKIGLENRPHCTAFVIDDTHAITAEHCVLEHVLFFDVPLEKINVLSDNNEVILKDVKITHSKDPRIDIALLTGDFSDFLKIPEDKHYINLSEKDEYLACGYPYGTKELVCSPITPYENYGPMYKAKGYLVFGFSGGPVINVTKGVVVAVNTALTDNFIIITPLTGIRGLFDLQ